MSKIRCILLWLLLVCSFESYSQEIPKVKVTQLEKIIKESKTPLVINFWATWCAPCVQELPYFLEEVKAHQKDSVKLILVSLDFEEAYPDKIIKFAKKKKIDAQIMWLDETDADYFCPKVDSKWSGVIPATLFINPKTGQRNFHETGMSHEEVKKEIMAILQ